MTSAATWGFFQKLTVEVVGAMLASAKKFCQKQKFETEVN